MNVCFPWSAQSCDEPMKACVGNDCHHLIHTLCRGTFTNCDESLTTNRFKFLLLHPRSQSTSMLRADAFQMAINSSHIFKLREPKFALTSVDEYETGLHDECTIIEQSTRAAHTANWCAQWFFFVLSPILTNAIYSNAQQTLTSCLFIVTPFNLPICVTFSIACCFQMLAQSYDEPAKALISLVWQHLIHTLSRGTVINCEWHL